jgi:hypothetical protein
MSRYYETDEEQEANKLGHKDAQHNRRDYDHDKYSDEPEDLAYWQGRKDEEAKIRIEEEERQIEEDERQIEEDRQEREFERQMQEEANQREHEEYQLQKMEEDSDQQTVSDFDVMVSQDDDSKSHYHGLPDDTQSEDDERPITEQELFNDILRDERNENELD